MKIKNMFQLLSIVIVILLTGCEQEYERIVVTNITLSHSTLEMIVGDTLTLTATIEPSNAFDKSVTWTSSDANIATVDKHGKVTAKGEGLTNITVASKDGEKFAKCEISVLQNIKFADEKMKKLCVQAYDTDGDGELSFKEAAVAPSEFRGFRDKDRDKIQSFDEFKYFTGVRVISREAFLGYSSLSSINIPDSVKFIGGGAFFGCDNLSNICIPDSVTEIQNETFWHCDGLAFIELGNGIKSIDRNAFACCESLPSIILPESVISIGQGAFYGCRRLTSINIPKSVKSIGDSAFSECYSLQSINIPDSVSVIGKGTFFYCSDLISVELGKRIKTIDNFAFENCVSLPRIILPESITSIAKGAFMNCDNIDIYIKSIKVPTLGEEVFEPTATIYVPNLSVKKYKAAPAWSEYADQIVGYDYENNKVVE